MNLKKLSIILDYIDSGGEIVDFKYDFFQKSLKLVVKVLEDNVEQVFSIIFKNISSLYINNSPGESRLDFDLVSDVEFWELSSIGYIKEGVGQSLYSSYGLFDDYGSNANFFLEIYNTLILLESHLLEINEEQYIIPQLDL
ncbi:YxiG family protein [Terribacillus saccharophilus]|uniref:YxiG family protein n=1 Tax=Terribacillus saccharophilus TaxID=361277 RepID=UPI002DC4ABEC|nr:hypothetical protein [Terribacillus saccharophilus]MEC0289160.1 hypothetical protein [Terribacillus saccharophilus]